MGKKAKCALGTAVFLLVLALLFQTVQEILVLKNSYVKYRNFLAQDHVDVLVLGNSHADNAIVPSALAEGLRHMPEAETPLVFNYAAFGMRMEQLYFFAREALKTHTPDVMVMDTYVFCPIEEADREVLARRAFDVWPLSANKIEAIQYCVTEDRWSYYLPIIKYHTRWKELRPEDVSALYDPARWNWAGTAGGNDYTDSLPDHGDGWFSQDPPPPWETRPLNETEEECFERFLELLAEKDIPLLLVSVPFKVQMGLDSMEVMKINSYLRENYVDGENVRLLDMNRMWTELDFGYGDLVDEGHVNRAGAAKVTGCLASYMRENYDIPAMTAG